MSNNNLKISPSVFEAFMMLLDKFDFYYRYSDDISVYRAGRNQEEILDSVCKSYPVLKDIYAHWEVTKTSKDPAAIANSNECIKTLVKQYIAEDKISTTDELKSELSSANTVLNAVGVKEQAIVLEAEATGRYLKALTEIRTVLKDFDSDDRKLLVTTILAASANIVAADEINYVASRIVDACKLISEMKWIPTVSRSSLLCDIYGLKIHRTLANYDTAYYGRIENSKGEIFVFHTEAEMLAYILRKFW